MRNTLFKISVLALLCSAMFAPAAAGSLEARTAPKPIVQYFQGCLGEGCIGVPAVVAGVGIIINLGGSSSEPGPWFGPRATGHAGGLQIAAGLTVGVAGLAFGPAVGLWGLGRRSGSTGSFWTASAGALGGLVAGGLVGLAIYGVSGEAFAGEVCGTAVGVLAAPAGAVIFYNLSRPKDTWAGVSLDRARFDLPTFALRKQADPEGRVSSVVVVQVLNARF